jgi:hypothetical protein
VARFPRIDQAKALGLLEDGPDGTTTRPTELGLQMYEILSAYFAVLEGKADAS